MVFAFAIVALRLGLNVKHPVSWVIAHTSIVVPVLASVAVDIVVDEHGLEISRAPAPIDVLLLGEEAGYILPAAIAHEPGFLQFDHIGIHKGLNGFAVDPLFKEMLVLFPGVITALDAAQFEKVGTMFE